MTKVQSGAVLIGIAIVLNLIGRGLTASVRSGHSVTGAGLLFALMLTSVVLGLFGLVRLISGMRDRN